MSNLPLAAYESLTGSQPCAYTYMPPVQPRSREQTGALVSVHRRPWAARAGCRSTTRASSGLGFHYSSTVLHARWIGREGIKGKPRGR